MKKHMIIKGGMAVCFALLLFLMPSNQMKARAAEVIATVQGTVSSGTTADLLKLSTKEGAMEIKIDSNTDTSACKLLLPGRTISVSVSHGSDGYLHAVKITSNGQTTTATVDTSKNSVVTGTISEKSKDDILYVNTQQGEMEIKLDPNTNMNGCTVIVANKTYSIACARGSDAYMHAIGIYDSASGIPGSGVPSGLTPAPASIVNAATTTVKGTVADSTKENLLYLATDSGEMQIVIDANTDSRSGMVLTSGRKLTVSVYRGSDAYMHAAVIVGEKESTATATMDTAQTATVTGTVGSKSNENTLYLSTTQGEMELKLDAVRSINGCKVFVKDKKVSVVCTRGSDAYMHALDITNA